MSRAKGCPRVPHKWPEFRGSFKALSYAETLSATISPTNCYIRHFKSRNCDVPQRRIYAHELTATPPQLVSAKRDVHSFRDAHKQVLSGVIRLADRFIDRRFLFFFFFYGIVVFLIVLSLEVSSFSEVYFVEDKSSVFSVNLFDGY